MSTRPRGRRNGHPHPIAPHHRTSRRGPAPCSSPKADSGGACLVLAIALGSGVLLLLAGPPLLLAAYFIV
jgi:hypothetical protein